MIEKQRLIKSLDLNMIESGVFWGKSTGSNVVELDPIVCISTEVPIPELNWVFSTRASRERIKPLVKETISYYEAVKKPFIWWVLENNLTEELKQLFEENNMHVKLASSAMGFNLENDIVELAPDEDLVIKRVSSKKELDDFGEASFKGFEIDKKYEYLYKNFIQKMRYASPKQELFVGYYKNCPQCTGLLYIEGGVAGLYWISTVPECRKKGYGFSLTTYMLKQIKKRGLKSAVLESSVMGINLYKKIGFEELNKVYLYSLKI